MNNRQARTGHQRGMGGRGTDDDAHTHTNSLRWQLSVVRTSPRLASAAAAAARTRRRRSLARRLATRLAADVRCARPTARGVACAALRAALRALLRCCHPALSLSGAAAGGDVAAAGAYAAAGAARLCDSARDARREHLTRRRRAGCASLWCCWCWCRRVPNLR